MHGVLKDISETSAMKPTNLTRKTTSIPDFHRIIWLPKKQREGNTGWQGSCKHKCASTPLLAIAVFPEHQPQLSASKLCHVSQLCFCKATQPEAWTRALASSYASTVSFVFPRLHVNTSQTSRAAHQHSGMT